MGNFSIIFLCFYYYLTQFFIGPDNILFLQYPCYWFVQIAYAAFMRLSLDYIVLLKVIIVWILPGNKKIEFLWVMSLRQKLIIIDI